MTRRHFLLLDVDNTLYPRSCGVVERVDERINRYLVERVGIAPEEVDGIRLRLWTEFGTTLHGLQRQAPTRTFGPSWSWRQRWPRSRE